MDILGSSLFGLLYNILIKGKVYDKFIFCFECVRSSPLLLLQVGAVTFVALTGLLVFMLFFLAATINAVVISLLMSLAAAGGFLALFFALATAIYIGALSVAIFVISFTAFWTIVAVLITAGNKLFGHLIVLFSFTVHIPCFRFVVCLHCHENLNQLCKINGWSIALDDLLLRRICDFINCTLLLRSGRHYIIVITLQVLLSFGPSPV